jgi:hypothetical protein
MKVAHSVLRIRQLAEVISTEMLPSLQMVFGERKPRHQARRQGCGRSPRSAHLHL